MKRIYHVFVLLLCAGLLAACSEDPPSLRIQNLRANKANVQIKPQAGSTININDVSGGETTGYQSIKEATYTISATVQSESVSPEASLTAINDRNYTVIIDTTTPPRLRIASEEK